MEEHHTTAYYLTKPFTKLPSQEAKKLALSALEQLEEEKYKGVGYQSLLNAIETAHAHPDSLRMQTAISKIPSIKLNQIPKDWRPKYAQIAFGPDGEEVMIFPRRLVTTYLTTYHPSNFILGLQEWERLSYKDKMRGMDTRLIARLARQDPEVRQVYDAALEKGVRYGLLLTLTTDSSTLTNGRGPLTDFEGYAIPYIRKLKLIVPKAKKKERELLNAFLDPFQIPNKKLIDKILGITD